MCTMRSPIRQGRKSGLNIQRVGRPNPVANVAQSRRFEKLDRRVFCGCELCRLRFNRMLYNRARSGEPLRSYRWGRR